MKNKNWEEKFTEKFGFIAHKGVQCDNITLDNIKTFIKENFIAKDEVREVVTEIEDLERGGELTPEEDLSREEAIFECLEIIKKIKQY